MKRRYIRLDSQIRKSKVVGLVCNRQVSKESLIDFINRFSQLYPNQKFVLINVYNKPIRGKKREISIISNRIEFHSYTFNDEGQTKWQGNHEGWGWALDHYCLGRKEDIELCKRYLSEDKEVLIYGAGEMSHKVIDYLLSYDININGIAVSAGDKNTSEIEGIKVKCIDEYKIEESICIVSIENEGIRECIVSELKDKGAYRIGYYLSKYRTIKFVEDNE